MPRDIRELLRLTDSEFLDELFIMERGDPYPLCSKGFIKLFHKLDIIRDHSNVTRFFDRLLDMAETPGHYGNIAYKSIIALLSASPELVLLLRNTVLNATDPNTESKTYQALLSTRDKPDNRTPPEDILRIKTHETVKIDQPDAAPLKDALVVPTSAPEVLHNDLYII